MTRTLRANLVDGGGWTVDKRKEKNKSCRPDNEGSLRELFGTWQGKKAAIEAILYSYAHGFSGFAAVLTPSLARIVAGLPGVVCVVPNRIFNLHTTRSWDFLQFNPQLSNGILSKGQSGARSVIGVLDSDKHGVYEVMCRRAGECVSRRDKCPGGHQNNVHRGH
ncbi:putative subtilisin-like protease SBT3.9 [Forsythia ovata]|uniref:Subtilisin-like protease SBT3.9 n=1 Tax=Forsythia ovata TaxID=205694 RepID=A0ABD1QC48_9LAMI